VAYRVLACTCSLSSMATTPIDRADCSRRIHLFSPVVSTNYRIEGAGLATENVPPFLSCRYLSWPLLNLQVLLYYFLCVLCLRSLCSKSFKYENHFVTHSIRRCDSGYLLRRRSIHLYKSSIPQHQFWRKRDRRSHLYPWRNRHMDMEHQRGQLLLCPMATISKSRRSSSRSNDIHQDKQ
jgi:hypothetical protein